MLAARLVSAMDASMAALKGYVKVVWMAFEPVASLEVWWVFSWDDTSVDLKALMRAEQRGDDSVALKVA